jgi:glycerol-3-phosphate dehydrogenase
MVDHGQFDFILIGGGINSAGIARDAAGRGLRVLLCEKGDLTEGTSSRSGKLVHGGLRYLEHYEFRLVREALIEREVLLAAAPHIIWPMRFVLPHSPDQRPAWPIRLGLLLYDHLGGHKTPPGCRSLDLGRDPEGGPIKETFRAAFEYSDCWIDDARLVVLNALDAQARGAVILTRTGASGARRDGGIWQVELTDLTVFGGKITTYRQLAEHALDRMAGEFPHAGRTWTAAAPLPGGDMPGADFKAFLGGLVADHPGLPADLVTHYARLYGTRARALIGDARDPTDLGRLFGGLLYGRKIDFLQETEWARTAKDVLDRRTKHGLHLTTAQRADVTRFMEGP